MENNDTNEDIEKWKIQKLVQRLNRYNGAGTSMISLAIPAGAQISIYQSRLTDEYGKSSNIKSRVNRLSVLSAITSTQQRLKLYSKTPKNGLVIYAGNITTEEGKEKKITIDFEPYMPLNHTLYKCDSSFHTEFLGEMLKSNDIFGFLIVGGDISLYGIVQGNHKEVRHQFEVSLPKKHNKGGQSSVRFARLRVEAIHNYIRKVAEAATAHFITNDLPNVSGIVLAGPGNIKNELFSSDLFDPRLKEVVMKILDTAYSGDRGFSQAIFLAQDILGNVKLVKEKKLLAKFFEEISRDTGKYAFGIRDVMFALEAGAVEDLLIYEDLNLVRYIIQDAETEMVRHVYSLDALKNEAERVTESVDFVDWIADNYKNFGTRLTLVSNKSQEGSQFCKGFGGVGGILRYKVELDHHDELDDLESSNSEFSESDFI